jgi:[CysO sulfur-carrier protein]-S-L-cysteine hydrolase
VQVSTIHEPLERMLQHVRSDSVRECCGLLAGRDGVITHIYPATNVASRPEAGYEIAPKEIFQRMREMRAAGLELLGIYHSHPNGKNEPSPRDIESAYYPETPYFILSPLADAERPVRAFLIAAGHVNELQIRILPADELNHESV